MEEVVRYSFRLRPGRTAQSALMAEWHRCRFLWNEAVYLQQSGERPTYSKLSKLLTDARTRSAWLRDGAQVPQQQMLRTYAQALAQSFSVQSRGWPKFKPRKSTRLSLEYTRRGFTIRNGRLMLAKGVSVPVVWSRRLPSEPTSVRVHQDSLGDWYASFVVRRSAEPVTSAGENTGIGIDQSRHDSRVWAKRIVDHHSLIAVEDFRPQFLAKSTLARKAADAAIGFAKRELVNRGIRAGRKVVLVQPAYTTMTCSRCFARAKQQLELAERTFRCSDCGYCGGRDRNAARVILAVAERGHTRVDDVSQSSHLLRAGGSVAVRA
ncbi:transposase [Nocardia sp. 2]|uniref:Transposase n=1 Tax=Nocardia acididurans TaxID=2802282 RepID=A0ABS1M8M2_9NOCA|nr:zinc ribbon domain-containing protein [Nocardia acididurans]MBL1077002.1 transposase [Nocardia acididurans]